MFYMDHQCHISSVQIHIVAFYYGTWPGVISLHGWRTLVNLKLKLLFFINLPHMRGLCLRCEDFMPWKIRAQ